MFELEDPFQFDLEERLKKGETDLYEAIFDYIITIVHDNNESIKTLNERIDNLNKYLHDAMSQVSNNTKDYIQYAINTIYAKVEERFSRLEKMIVSLAKGETVQIDTPPPSKPPQAPPIMIELPTKPSLPPPPAPMKPRPRPTGKRTLLDELKEKIKGRYTE